MPEKCDRSGATLSANPWNVTQRCTRMPMAAILSSAPWPLLRPAHPHADAIVAALAAHVEGRKRADDPFLDGGDEAANVGRAALEIEHDIADPLARPMIGELAAAAGRVNRKARLDQFLRPRRRAGGVERQGARAARPVLAPRPARSPPRAPSWTQQHAHSRPAAAHAPFDRRRAGNWESANLQIAARVNHLVTMPGSRIAQ